MNAPNELADRYVALWNEPDPDGRRLPELRRVVHSSGHPAPDDGGRVLRPAPPTESRCLDDTDQRR
jgi:hypothetical protein